MRKLAERRAFGFPNSPYTRRMSLVGPQAPARRLAPAVLAGSSARAGERSAASANGLGTSPALAVSTLVLRLVAALIPVVQLWVAKLIIDQIVHPQPEVSVLELPRHRDRSGRFERHPRPRHRPVRQSARRQIPPYHVSPAAHGARHSPGPGFLRRSSVLRQDGARPPANHRPSRNAWSSGCNDPAAHYLASLSGAVSLFSPWFLCCWW